MCAACSIFSIFAKVPCIAKLLWAALWRQDETARITVLGRMAISLPLVLATEKKWWNDEMAELATGFASVIFSVSYGSSMVLASWFGTLAISNYLLSLKHLIYILGICGPVDLASCVHVSVLHTSGKITRISTSFMVIPGHSSLYDFSGVGTPRIYACAV